MNSAERGNLFLAIRRAYLFSDRVGEQLQRAYNEFAGEPFRLLALVEAAQELRMSIILEPLSIRNTMTVTVMEPTPYTGTKAGRHWTHEGHTNADALLLALADALAVEVPA